MHIKHNCWKCETASGAYFVKKYEDILTEQKVKRIHQKLSEIQFPYHIPIAKQRSGLLVQHWLEGRSVSFENQQERIEAVNCLQALHKTNAKIDWQQEHLPRQKLIQKWIVRYERFLSNEDELLPYLNYDFYTIANTAHKAINQLAMIAQPTEEQTLLHGDVVHHNFFFTDGKVTLIDFDLATFGSPVDEMLLWLHRALPNANYELGTLLKEHPYTKICLPRLAYVQYPNELLREWLYILQLDESERQPFLDYLMPFTKQALKAWPKLINQIEKYAV
ncbi:phosphotransferase [Solibacillus sp. CAU 1738]|uniref:phosphotransferase n=1 Tax=Solibacillus sp. CAU 1738 TaxID=3140363 RepID=UPI00326014EE